MTWMGYTTFQAVISLPGNGSAPYSFTRGVHMKVFVKVLACHHKLHGCFQRGIGLCWKNTEFVFTFPSLFQFYSQEAIWYTFFTRRQTPSIFDLRNAPQDEGTIPIIEASNSTFNRCWYYELPHIFIRACERSVCFRPSYILYHACRVIWQYVSKCYCRWQTVESSLLHLSYNHTTSGF